MSNLVSEIHARWGVLRSSGVEATGGKVAASELGVPTGYGTAKLGTDADGRAQLLLPVAAGTRRPRFDDLSALEIGAAILADAGKSRSYLIVTCLDPALDRAFADLVEAVLSRISAGESALASLVTAVRDLKALFNGAPQGVADDRTVRGLAAELFVLERLARRHVQAPEIWFGPDRQRHDFRGGDHAIEVKSTARAGGPVSISSVDQLNAPVGGTLQLWRIVLERTVQGPLTIRDLVSAIESRTGRSPVLRERLAAMGCPDPAAPDWNHLSFSCEAVDAWNVTDGFPRIVPATFGGDGVPEGITALTYQLDLAQASRFRSDEGEMAAMEERILACLA